MHPFLNDNAKKLKPYTPGEQPQGGGWAKLNTNEFPYPPSPKVQRGLEKMNREYENLRKYPHPFSEPLRSRLAQKWELPAENVLITNGSDEALMLIARIIFDKGERAASPEVTYSLYETIAGSVGAIMERAPMKPVMKDTEPFRIDLEALENSKAKAIFLANPNAATGEYIATERLKKAVQNSKKLWIVDEAYIDFPSAGKASLLHQGGSEKNLIVVQTFSKGYGLAGLRVGYAVSKDQAVMEALYAIKDSYNQDQIAIHLASEALCDQAYYEKKLREIKDQRKFLTHELQKNGFVVLSSEANFLLVKPRSGDAERVYLGLKKKKILVRYFKSAPLSDYIRVSIGSPRENQTLLRELLLF